MRKSGKQNSVNGGVNGEGGSGKSGVAWGRKRKMRRGEIGMRRKCWYGEAEKEMQIGIRRKVKGEKCVWIRRRDGIRVDIEREKMDTEEKKGKGGGDYI